MDKLIIQGKKELRGDIKVSGAKNLALKLLAATILVEGESRFTNVPEIQDIKVMIDIIKDLGGHVENPSSGEYIISTKDISKNEIDQALGAKIRTSIMFVAPLLARFGEVKFTLPGGDKIGQRPIDIFIDGYEEMGAVISKNGEHYHLSLPSGFIGTKVVFPWITNTATESLILAAVKAKGKSIFHNCPLEPEVVELCKYLKERGAKIKGEGTPTLEIEGVSRLTGGEFRVFPDRIETGTFAVLGALAGTEINIINADPSHLEVYWKMLGKAGVKYELKESQIKIKNSLDRLNSVELRTHEYPGFPTDLQPIFTVLLTQARGLSMVHETIHEGRLIYTEKLNKMGAKIIICDPHRVIVNGPTPLFGTKLESPDIRAGIALLIASLIAEGNSEIYNIYQIDRGYEDIVGRLNNLGAGIARVDDDKITN